MKEIGIKTNARIELKDITNEVKKVVSKSTIKNGIVTLFVPHTTAGITINENADPSVVSDMQKTLNTLVPFENNYRHAEGNSQAHLLSSLVGASEHLIIQNGLLVLGTWQGIYFAEFDGPRNRKLYIEIVGD